jgi:hypothetical protein
MGKVQKKEPSINCPDRCPMSSVGSSPSKCVAELLRPAPPSDLTIIHATVRFWQSGNQQTKKSEKNATGS